VKEEAECQPPDFLQVERQKLEERLNQALHDACCLTHAVKLMLLA
jgi:hypothetical protein